MERRAVQILAVIALALAAMCVGLAIAWKDEHDAAACWQAQAEDDYAPACPRR